MAASARYRLSGGAANTDPTASLGGSMSTAAGGVITTGQDQNVFDLVTGQESNDGDVEYRCIYVENNGDQTLLGAVLWIDTQSANGDVAEAVGLDPAAIGANSTTTVANENTAPAGVAFTVPASKAGGLAIGDIPAASKKAFWERRTVSAGAAPAPWSFSVRVEGDSNA